MSAPIKQNAAFRWIESGQERLHYLGAKLRRPVSNPVQNVSEHVSADLSTIRRVSIGNPVYELSAGCRFDGQPEQLARFIAAARRGASVEYLPSLANPSESYPCVLMNADMIAPDRDLWWHPRYETEIVLRRIDGGSWAGVTERSLFYWRAGNAPPGLEFTRAGTNAWAPDESGIYQEPATGIWRTGWADRVAPAGIYDTPYLPTEPERTNDVLDSADVDVDNSANWAEAVAWTQADVTSLFEGELAVKYTNDGVTGSHSVFQAMAFTLEPLSMTYTVLVENVDATATVIGLRDTTAPAWVVLGTYTWATDSFVETDSTVGSSTGVRHRIITENGPNGGRVVELQVYGVADNNGNNGSYFVYPTGTGTNSLSAIVHHVQYEGSGATVGSSPMVAGAGSVTRPAESWRASYPHTPRAASLYLHGKELGTRLSGDVLPYAYLGSGAARWSVLGLANGDIEIGHDNGPTFVSTSFTTGLPAFGEDFEIVAHLNPDGSVDGVLSVEGGSAVTAAASGAAQLAKQWGAPYIHLGWDGGTAHGLSHLYTVKKFEGILSIDALRSA